MKLNTMIVGALLVGCVDSHGTHETVDVSPKLAELGIARADVSRSDGDTDVQLFARDGQVAATLHYSGDEAHAQVTWKTVRYDLDTSGSSLSINDDRGEAGVARVDETGSVRWDAGSNVSNVTETLDVVATVAGELGIAGPWLVAPHSDIVSYLEIFNGTSCDVIYHTCVNACFNWYGGLWGRVSGQLTACYDGCEASYTTCGM